MAASEYKNKRNLKSIASHMTAPRHRICALRRGWCELAPCVFLGRPPSRTFAPSSCHECARFGPCRPGRLVLVEALGARCFFDPMQIPRSHELTYSLAPQSSTVPSEAGIAPWRSSSAAPTQTHAPIFSGARFRHFCFVYLPRMCPLWSSPDTLNFSAAPSLLSLCPAPLGGGAGRN